MTDEKWSKVWGLYREWRDRPAHEYEIGLDSGLTDPEIAAELRALLEATRSLVPGHHQPEVHSTETIYASGFNFSRYAILGVAGRGGSGQIYLARDRELGRTVALKCLPGENAHDPEDLMREARAASVLNHPNIVTVYEVIRFDDQVAIAMEFVEGQSLRQLLGAPLLPDSVIRYAIQIGDALAATHAMGIVHGDIKPENIMVRPDGYLKVLDFGLARRLEDQGERSIAGTLRYIPPEVLNGETTSERGDIFSFGLVLYEMAAGAHAFPGKTQFDTAEAISKQEPISPRKVSPGISRPLELLILQMLDKDPAKRPGAAKIVAQLRQMASHELPTSNRWRHWQWGVAAIVLVLALLMVRVWQMRDQYFRQKELVFSNFTSTAADGLTAGVISPDGHEYVFADREGVIRKLFIPGVGSTANPNLSEIGQIPNQRVDQVAWTGGQERVLLSSRTIDADDATGILSVVDLTSGKIRQLPLAGRRGVASPDGSLFAYTSVDGQVLEVAEFETLHILCRIPVNYAGGVKGIVWSPAGHSLHYWTTPEGRLPLHLWRSSILHTLEARTGRLMLEQKLPAVLCAVMLQDGRLLYEGNQSSNLAEVRLDSATERLAPEIHPLGQLVGLETNLSASADGRTIVGIVWRRPVTSLHVGDLDAISHRLKNVLRLSDPSTEAFPHAWMPDNQAIIYESSRFGSQDLFLQPLNSNRATRIVAMPGEQVLANLSPSGKLLLFLSGPVAPSSDGITQWQLMRMPITGGPATEVHTEPPVQEFACKFQATRCVLREYQHGEMIFSALDPLRGKGSELMRIRAEKPVLGDWALSPDGRKVTLLDFGGHRAAIRILDLDQKQEHRVELAGPLPTGGTAVWSVDEKGWFLAQEPDRMMFYDTQGVSHYVGPTGHWLVPSWDGKKAAFTEKDPDADGYIAHR